MLNYFPAKEVHLWGCSSAGRAQGWQSWGQGFDPPQLHQKTIKGLTVRSALFVFWKNGDRTQGSLRERISLMLWGSTRGDRPPLEAGYYLLGSASSKFESGKLFFSEMRMT